MSIRWTGWLGLGSLLLALILWLVLGRTPDLNPMVVPWEEPSYFVRMHVPADNPITEEGVALGRRLFYDPILSADSSTSCSTCHQPGRAFTDGRPLAIGVRGRRGERNAPTLLNVGYLYKGLFWDGRVLTLEEQALHPVREAAELGNTWAEVARRLERHPEYPSLFEAAFGAEVALAIDSHLVAKALAQFQRTLVSYDSKYDRVMRGEAIFNPSEERGFKIFFDADPEHLPVSECGHCHLDPMFTDQGYFNNGIDSVRKLEDLLDPGRFQATGIRYDRGKFRTPTLRNIALTAPYMHDGRFDHLEEVLDHYQKGGHAGINVSPNVMPLQLDEQDRQDLINFLNTLTDTSAVENEAYANPFY